MRVRILGYEITLEKPAECSICHKNGDLEILDRVVDNDNDTLKYALVLKCRNCHELFMVTYLIGNVKQLEEIQQISKQTPIKSIEHKTFIRNNWFCKMRTRSLKCEFIEAPLFEGATRDGTELAYKVIKNEYSKKTAGTFTDYVDCLKKHSFHYSCGAKNIEAVVRKCENVRTHVLDAFRNGSFPIIIGGDHSVAMSSIAAGSETFGIDNYCVIYIDGHADINTDKTSSSHNIHGMPLASSLGICDDKLRIGPLKQKLLGKNIYILGARSIDEPEYKIIEDNNVRLYKNDCFFEKLDDILDTIKTEIGNKKVHISFDVDVLDPQYFVSTGYLMEKGLSIKAVESIIDFAFQNLDVVSFDIVEYNPLLDNNGTDLNTVVNFIKRVENYIYNK